MKNKNINKQIDVRKTIGTSTIVVCAFVLFCLITRSAILGVISNAVANFFLGIFGIVSYAVASAGIVAGTMILLKRKITLPKLQVFNFCALFFAIMLFAQLITSHSIAADNDYTVYLGLCYDYQTVSTFGGAFAGLFVWPLCSALSVFGAYVFVIAFLILTVFIAVEQLFKISNIKIEKEEKEVVKKAPVVKEYPQSKLFVASFEENNVQAVQPKTSKSFEELYGDKLQSFDVEQKEGAENQKSAHEQLYGDYWQDTSYTKPDQPQRGSVPNTSYTKDFENYYSVPTSDSEIKSAPVSSFGQSFDQPPAFFHSEESFAPGSFELKKAEEFLMEQNEKEAKKEEAKRSLYALKGNMTQDTSLPPIINGDEVSARLKKKDFYEQRKYSELPPPRSLPEENEPVAEKVVEEAVVQENYHETVAVEENIDTVTSDDVIFEEDIQKQDYSASNFNAYQTAEDEIYKAVSTQQTENIYIPVIEEQTEELYDSVGSNTSFENTISFDEDDIIKFEEECRDEVESVADKSADVNEEQIDSAIEETFVDEEPAIVEEQPVVAEEISEEKQEIVENYQEIAEEPTKEVVEEVVAEPVKFVEKPFINKTEKAFQVGIANVVGGEENKKPIHKYKKYIPPVFSLLDDTVFDPKLLTEDFEGTGIKIQETLGEFKVDATLRNIVTGPTVTRYEFEIAKGISVTKVNGLVDDISLAIAAPGPVRIQTPIPGKSLFGIEVPNKKVATVSLRSVLESSEFMGAPQKGLTYALGIDIGGKNIVADIADMPHMLIAGATGQGKSVCVNSIIISMLYKYGPEELRFIMVDPKQVEFTPYGKLPHLMINHIICEPEKAISAFDWLIKEMERRFKLFAEYGVRDINGYNNAIDTDTTEKLARIVLIVDEVADLMQYNKSEIESRVQRLTQKARAAGIHLILATQRPSVDVITGVVKANIPSRLALRVASAVDSRTILDQVGAEKLVAKGDMLFRSANMPEPIRLQGAFVSDGEVAKIVDYIAANNETYFDNDIAEAILKSKKEAAGANGAGGDDEVDELFYDALKFVIEAGQASISMIIRRFPMGWNRAGRLLQEMEDRGFVSQYEGSKPRQVLITMDQYEKLIGNE